MIDRDFHLHDNGMADLVCKQGEYGNIKRVVQGDRVGSKVRRREKL